MKYNIHTHHPSTEADTLAIFNQKIEAIDFTVPHFSLGIHPWSIDSSLIQVQLSRIEAHINHPNCLALGECGLDKKIEIPLSLQEEVLVEQLLLAEKNKKAVILHVVSAYQEIIALKKRLNITVPLLVHGFNKHQQVAESLWKNGFYLSFGPALLQNKKVQDTFSSVPKDFVFLETDNDTTSSIADVYAKAAELQPNIEQVVESNFKKVFKNE